MVVMDGNEYLTLFHTNQLIKLVKDPTKRNQGKVQRILQIIKSKLTKSNYLKLYSTLGSNAAKVYDIVKLNKISKGNSVDQPMLTPVTFNIGNQLTNWQNSHLGNNYLL